MDNYSDILRDISELSVGLVKLCGRLCVKVSTAESCTGGMISSAITSVPGSSDVIELGVCSYSNRIKREVLGVSGETLDNFTEYSEECAREMALGAVSASGADFGVSTTGIAGPSGGTEDKPVGLVYMAAAGKGLKPVTAAERFPDEGGDGYSGRDYIRACAARFALRLLYDYISAFDVMRAG